MVVVLATTLKFHLCFDFILFTSFLCLLAMNNHALLMNIHEVCGTAVVM